VRNHRDDEQRRSSRRSRRGGDIGKRWSDRLPTRAVRAFRFSTSRRPGFTTPPRRRRAGDDQGFTDQEGRRPHRQNRGVSGLNDLTYYATRAWIDKHGGNSAAVKFIELPFPAMAAAVAQRRIDAAYVIEPFLTASAGDLHILSRAAESVAPRYQATGWIASESWLQSHADVALRFGSVMRRTAIWRTRITKNRPRSCSNTSSSIHDRSTA